MTAVTERPETVETTTRPTVRIEDLRAGLLAFEVLPENPLGARTALAELCTRHGLDRAARGLVD